MKLVGITMMTNPEARQDPWSECLRQMLEICDFIVVTVGREADMDMVTTEMHGLMHRIRLIYIHWEQPEWCYSELPKHLNPALQCAKDLGADWVVRFDTDCFIHELEREKLRSALEKMPENIKVACLNKRQFFLGTTALEKTKVPIVVRGNSEVWYGMEIGRYTDLLQPIILKKGVTHKYNSQGVNPVPLGEAVKKEDVGQTGCTVWNYDYTFKTLEKSTELLYWWDIAHAKFWGTSYQGRNISEVTRETALSDYVDVVVKSRLKNYNKSFPAELHPKHIVEKIKNITPEQFGHSFWGKIKL